MSFWAPFLFAGGLLAAAFALATPTPLARTNTLNGHVIVIPQER